MEYFKKYLGRGRYLNGLSVQNPELYRWWYRAMKTDEIPMYGNKLKKDAIQVPIENVKEETYEMPEVLDFEIKNALSNALSKLTPREERVIRERFFHGKSLEEVGQQFSVTRESIRRNEARALRKLRHPSMGLRKVA